MTYVYVRRYPFDVENKEIIPHIRRDEIDKANNEVHRQQKYYAWKLLEKAVFEKYGIKMDELSFSLNVDGKWECDKLYFSLSHTKDTVAVALSEKPCGIDVEYFSPERFGEKLARRILTEKEFLEYSVLDENERNEYTFRKWTQKESIFKMLSGSTFMPRTIETSEYFTRFSMLSECGVCCSLSDEEKIEYVT